MGVTVTATIGVIGMVALPHKGEQPLHHIVISAWVNGRPYTFVPETAGQLNVITRAMALGMPVCLTLDDDVRLAGFPVIVAIATPEPARLP